MTSAFDLSSARENTEDKPSRRNNLPEISATEWVQAGKSRD